VAINLTLGENGIMKRAQESRVAYSEKEAREKLELVLLDMQADKVTNNQYNQDEYLTNKLQEHGMRVEGNIVYVDGWQFSIDRDVPKIVASLGKGQLDRHVGIDAELERLLKEANMTLTVNDILNTPAIMKEVPGLIPQLSEADVTRQEVDGIITYTDNKGGITRTPSEHIYGILNAWKAFDNDLGTQALSKEYSAEGYYIDYEFAQEVYAMQIRYVFTNGSSYQGTRTIVIEGYDEESDKWNDVSQELTWIGVDATRKEDVGILDYSKPYKRYRLYVKSATASSSYGLGCSGLYSMQLYGVNKRTENEEEQKQLLLANSNIDKITLSQMTTNKEFIKELINKLSVQTVSNNQTLMENLPGLIPQLSEADVTRQEVDGIITYTDNKGGITRTPSEHTYGIYNAWKAFDNDLGTPALSKEYSAEGYYIDYEFAQEVYVMQINYIFTNGSSYDGKMTIFIQGYDEENDRWIDVSQELTWTGNGNTKKEDVEILDYSKPYKRYRLYVKSATASSSYGLGGSGLYSMQLYGKTAQ